MSRLTMLVAVTYTAALAIWTIGKLALGDVAQSTGLIAASSLLITQCIIFTIITPWLVCDEKPKMLTELLPLLTTPWPLLLFVVLVSGIPVITIVASQVWVVGLIILSYFLARGILKTLREGQLRTIALTALQLVPAIALWTGSEVWIPWILS